MFEDGPCPGLKEMACLSDDVYDYFFPSQVSSFNHTCILMCRSNYYLSINFQGKVKVDSIDDNEELEFTDAAFDTLGFSV